MSEFWDEWRGQDGKPTMLIKRLVKVGGFRVDLHKFISADDPGCFHSHPAWAVRMVLWGGYIEQVWGAGFRRFFPGRIGIISPAFAHRVSGLVYRASYSLWVRGPVIAEVKLLGDGWKP